MVDEVVVEKKKRGRPRKNPVVAEESFEGANVDKSEAIMALEDLRQEILSEPVFDIGEDAQYSGPQTRPFGPERAWWVPNLAEAILLEIVKHTGKCNDDVPQIVFDRATKLADLLEIK